ncbi:MAG: hypothetical protein IJ412_05125 [Oscillospiraceae bacterium]|nr:hypothetical protein [Oscillospiraceae bacterium]
MHPSNSHHSKIPLAWIVTAALLIIALSVGGTYCRLIDWSSTEVVYSPVQTDGYGSDCLVEGGQKIVLANWQSTETQRVLTIAVQRPVSVAEAVTDAASSENTSSQTEPESAATTDTVESNAPVSGTASSADTNASVAGEENAPESPEAGEVEDTPVFDPAEVTVLLDESAGIHLLPAVQLTNDSIQLVLERRTQGVGLSEIVPMSVRVIWRGLEATFHLNMMPYDPPAVTGNTLPASETDMSESQNSSSTSAASSGAAVSSKSSVSSGSAISSNTVSGSQSAVTSDSSAPVSSGMSDTESVSQSGTDSSQESDSQSNSQSSGSAASAPASGSGSVSESGSGSESESKTESSTEKHEIVTDLELLEYTPIADISAPVTAVRLNLETQSDFTLRFHSMNAAGEKAELKKVRYSLDGGKSYTMLYDTNAVSLLWPYAENWDGTVLLDFGTALPAEHRPVITVSALKYTSQELHPTLETAPSLSMGLVLSSKMPYNVTIAPLWNGAQLQVQSIERLTKTGDGSLAYAADKTVSAVMTQEGFQLIRTKDAVYPTPGSYRMNLVWDWNGVPLRKQTVYFFINTN